MSKTEKRFIAFIDIMGFKDLVARHSHNEILSKLEFLSECVDKLNDREGNKILKEKYAEEELIPFIFSDSIAIFTSNDSPRSLQLLIYATQYIFKSALFRLIPVKGAISHGVITLDREKSIFFGQAIIDAYLLQEELKYYGIIAHHSVESRFKGLSRLQEFANLVISLKTPTKGGTIAYENVRMYSDKEAGEPDYLKLLNTLYHTVSGSPRIYVDNTIDMFNKSHSA